MTISDLISHIRRELGHAIQGGPAELSKLFKYVDRPNDRLVFGASGIPEAVACPIGRYIFLPLPHINIDRKSREYIIRYLTQFPDGEPVAEEVKSKPGELEKAIMDRLDHPRTAFTMNQDRTCTHIATGEIIEASRYANLVELWKRVDTKRRANGTLEDSIESEIRRGKKFHDLWEKQEDGNYIFLPWRGDITAEVAWQKWGRLRKQYQPSLKDGAAKANYLRSLKPLSAEEIKRNKLRSLTDEADRAA